VKLASGTLIGEYEVHDCIGEGSFGVVYSAIHPIIGKKAAIKVLKREAAVHSELVQRFRREARAVNAIEHPNIVDIFGFGSLPDGRPYLIMEYLEGMSLEDLLRAKGGCLPEEELFLVLSSVAQAVDAAHRCGVVHRDLKPDNIFIIQHKNVRNQVKVLDFGIAKLASCSMASTQLGRQLGTPLYMSPEQCFGSRVNHLADVYAFGVIAYQGLTGNFPIYGETMMQIASQHLLNQRLPPSYFAPACAKYDTVIQRCLAQFPEQRFPTLSTAYEALVAAYLGDNINNQDSQPHSITIPISYDLISYSDSVSTSGDAWIDTRSSTLSESASIMTTIPMKKEKRAQLAIIASGIAVVFSIALIVPNWISDPVDTAQKATEIVPENPQPMVTAAPCMKNKLKQPGMP